MDTYSFSTSLRQQKEDEVVPKLPKHYSQDLNIEKVSNSELKEGDYFQPVGKLKFMLS